MIEALIAELTASIKENTAALRDVLANAGSPTWSTSDPAPAPRGKPKSVTPAVTEPEPEPTPAVTEPEPQTPQDLRKAVQEYAKSKLIAADSAEFKAAFAAELASLGIEKAARLSDDQLAPFFAKMKSW
jgi:hypothetical protein